MHTQAIEIDGITAYARRTRLELPATGVVLISGENGQGKSTWLEAVAEAGWGETLRGTPPWRRGAPGTIRLETFDGLTLLRSTTKGGTRKLDWWRGADQVDRKRWETTTKAGLELASEIGAFETWKRTSVFSAADADTFSDSTPGDRLALLERMFGLDRFRPALERAREAKKAADRRRTVADLDVRNLRALIETNLRDLETNRKALRDARVFLSSGIDEDLEAVDVAGLERQAAGLREQAVGYREQLRTAEQRIQEIDVERDRARERKASADIDRAAASERASEADRKVATLAGGVCPTCGVSLCPKCGLDLIAVRLEDLQATAASRRQEAIAAEARASAMARQAQEVAAEAARKAQEARGAVEELRDERSALEKRAAQVDERARAERRRAEDQRRLVAERKATRARTEKALEGLEGAIRGAEKALAKNQAAVEAMEAKLATETQGFAVLEAVDRVLGLQGVRTQVLGRGLAGLGAVTNSLFRIAGWDEINILLRPYRELADGTRRDEIDLVIEGAGGGYGYQGTSGGERRRIDVGLVLGFAELSAAAHGRRAGTLWMDEVFDALDGPGLDGIGRILAAMSRDRAIVVITHRAELADRLDPAMEYHVEHHELRRVA